MDVEDKDVLDVGCGPRKIAGSIGLDRYSYPDVDIVADLERMPWPLPSGRFGEVHFNSSMEHLSDICAVMREVHRVSRSGARVFIHSPHYTSQDAYADVTHKHAFSIFSFDYFLEGREGSFMRDCDFRLVTRRIDFWPLLGFERFKPYWLVERLANVAPNFYERFLAFMFPARSIHVVLEVVKPGADRRPVSEGSGVA